MFNEKILKVAKKVLDKKSIDHIRWNMHYNVEKNLLTITDWFILVEIWMPEKYKKRFENLPVEDVTIDYWTVCGLYSMLEHAWASWELFDISLWNAKIPDYIEFENMDISSVKCWKTFRFPIVDAKKLPSYKEESLFNSSQDSVKKIWITKSFKKFQDVCKLLCDKDLTVAEVKDQTYTAEWKIIYMLTEQLTVRICVTRGKEYE